MDGDTVEHGAIEGPGELAAEAPDLSDRSANLPAPIQGSTSVRLDRAVVRALATGAAIGAVIEEAANAIRVMCPDRGVAVWYRCSDGTPTVQAAGIGAGLVMIAGDPDSVFWDRARGEERPNYDITLRAGAEDTDATSVWCVPITEGPVTGDLTLVATAADDGRPPDGDVAGSIEHLTQLIGLGLDRDRLVRRLETFLSDRGRPDGPHPGVQTGITPTLSDGDEPAETALLFVRLAQIEDIEHIHGHQAAEELTKEVGRRLGKTVRPGDTIARLSATDFALRCYEVTAIQAESIATRVLNDLWTPVTTRWEETRLRPRIGLTRAGEATPLSRMLHDADSAMHQADSVGRDWLWDTDDVELQPREPAPTPTQSGFGTGPISAAQSDPGRLDDSASGSPT